MKNRRIIWILPVSAKIGSVLLSPEIRLIHMAGELAKAGFSVKLVLSECLIRLPEEVEPWFGNPRQLPAEPDDFVIANPFLPFLVLWNLFRGKSRLVVDFYSVHLPEFIQEESLHTPRVFDVQRRRIWLRYRWLARKATWCIFSNPEQLAFLCGGLSHQASISDLRLASSLPAKSIFCPMGIDPSEIAVGYPNPYPSLLHDRSIFLWGGGIWPWMDLAPLLDAFVILQKRGSKACLYFLSGAAADSSNRLSHPVEKVKKRAESLGILNANVFLNPNSVPFNSRISYVEYCTAGILCNPPTIESACSWRTRILDLLLAGRSAVVAGYDPLSDELAGKNAIEYISLNPAEIADAVERLESSEHREILESQIKSLSKKHSWEITMSPLIQSLTISPPFQHSMPSLHPSELLRFASPF